MIHEFALEPETVATWADRRLGRYFVESFGIGTPRVVSRFPKRWKRMVWEAFVSENEIARKRMEEVLARLSETMVARQNSTWNPEEPWLENALLEHGQAPFRAIVAGSNPTGHPSVLVGDDIDDGKALWKLPHGDSIERAPEALSEAVCTLLRAAKLIVFVDPYFAPQRDRFRRSLKAFLQACLRDRVTAQVTRLELLSSDDSKNGTPEYFEAECRARLPRLVPIGQRLTIQRLHQRQGGERLHNRYILTDLGGVKLGVGLDKGEEGDSDDINLLDRGQYELRWRQYASEHIVFDRVEAAIVIDGEG